MPKITLLFAVLALSIAMPLVAGAAVPRNVVGRILLQTESRGEAWYVSPVDERRTYLADGAAAYQLLRDAGLGITNANLARIPVGIETRFADADADGDGLADQLEIALGTNPGDEDSDDDGHSDGTEITNGYDPLRGAGAKLAIDATLVTQLSGRILIQVESHGEAWYVHPAEGRRYYMKDGEAAYQIMRYLSLGITNKDLESVPVVEGSTLPSATSPVAVAPTTDPNLHGLRECGFDRACFLGAVEAGLAANVYWKEYRIDASLPGGLYVATDYMALSKNQFDGDWQLSRYPETVAYYAAATDRHLLTEAGMSAGEADAFLAEHVPTRESFIARGFTEAQIDGVYAPGAIDGIIGTDVGCGNVDLNILDAALRKWIGGDRDITITSITDDGFRIYGGDYSFGYCSEIKPPPAVTQ